MNALLIIARLLVVFCFVCAAVAADQMTGVLYDEAKLLTPAEAGQIEALLEKHNTSGPGRVFVRIIEKLPANTTMEAYALKQINVPPRKSGEKLERILLAVAVKDRKLRMETSKGVRDQIPDAVCQKIIDEKIVPRFKEKKYFDGIHAALQEVTVKLKR